jgi:hypothetical protein
MSKTLEKSNNYYQKLQIIKNSPEIMETLCKNICLRNLLSVFYRAILLPELSFEFEKFPESNV